MPVLDGLATIEHLATRPETDRPAVVALTTFNDRGVVDRAVAAGVDGFLLETGSPHDLVAAVRDAAHGGVVLSPRVARHLADRLRAAPSATDERIARLTARERDVLDHLARGLSDAEIGGELGLTEGTVKGYVSVLFDRLEVRNRVEAALLAHRRR